MSFENAVQSENLISTRRNIFLARDYQSLSLFRILFAIFLAADFFICVLPYYGIFYTDQGLLPRDALFTSYHNPGLLSLLTACDYRVYHLLFIAAHILAILAFGIGFKTRWANLILFITYTSMFWRNPMLNSNAEFLAKLLLLWSLFLPMARYWSVDAALDPEPRDRPYPAIPFTAIRMQISIVYIFSFFYKFAGAPWWNGMAVGITLRDNLFGATVPGLWLADHFAGYLWLVTYAVMAFQFLFVFLVYSPFYNGFTRGIALLGSACMHTAFLFMLNVGTFPFICIIYLVILVPDEWWNKLLASRRARLGRIRIFYEPGCEFCRKTALLFREFCLPTGVPVLAADQNPETLALLKQNNSWVVYDTEGRPLMHWRAVSYVLKQNPFLWFFGALTDLAFLQPAMRKLYGWIGARRPLWGRWTAALLPFHVQPSLNPVTAGFCLFLMVTCLSYQTFDIPKPFFLPDTEWVKLKKPRWLQSTADFFQVAQKWNIFAPIPTHQQRHYAITGYKPDGASVDIVSLQSPPFFQSAPDNYSVEFINHRWLVYFTRFEDGGPQARAAMAHYLCGKTNSADADPLNYITRVEIRVYEDSLLNAWTPDSPPKFTETYSCAGYSQIPLPPESP